MSALARKLILAGSTTDEADDHACGQSKAKTDEEMRYVLNGRLTPALRAIASQVENHDAQQSDAGCHRTRKHDGQPTHSRTII